MFPLNVETALPLAGILLGMTFGLVSAISKEEKVKYVAISVFGTIIVAFCGISFYAYGYSLEVLLAFFIWSCVGFIPTFIIGLGYRRRRDRGWSMLIESPFYHPDRWEIEEIQRNAPKTEAELRITGNLFFGYKIEISLKIKNVSEETLDRLHASLKVSDLGLKKKEKEQFKDLPNLLPNEERKYTISEKIGRTGKYAIDLRIIKRKVLLAEFHWTMK